MRVRDRPPTLVRHALHTPKHRGFPARRFLPGTRRRRAVSHTPLGTRLVGAFAILLGTGMLLYPSASDWFATRAHAGSLESYAETVARLPDEALREVLDRAHTYNAGINDQTLSDPYTSTAAPDPEATDYRSQLRVEGADTMAWLRVPEIDLSLPVRHGTSARTLAEGVGHLQGTSLPVGGEGTNSVLTGHSGLPTSTLFTNLNRLERGSRLYIDVLGTTLAYEVTLIETVLPTHQDLLRIEPGRDYLTLVTCTPVPINSHRLIIRAERVQETIDDEATPAGATRSAHVPFPWWMLGAAAALTFAMGLVIWPHLRRRHGTDLRSNRGIGASRARRRRRADQRNVLHSRPRRWL